MLKQSPFNKTEDDFGNGNQMPVVSGEDFDDEGDSDDEGGGSVTLNGAATGDVIVQLMICFALQVNRMLFKVIQ